MTGQRRLSWQWIALVGLGVAVVLYAAGAFEGGRIAPGRAPEPPGLPAPSQTTTAQRGSVAVIEEAVGTVQSKRRIDVAAQVSARVVSVGARAGDRVTAGEPLVILDDADFTARFTRAKAQYERVSRFLARQAATPEQMEAAQAEYSQAQAAIAHTRILAPIDGVVAERHVEPGDLALPGRPLLVVLDPGALRLEAQVREEMIVHVVPGSTLEVVMPAIGTTAKGTVAEVLPSADPRSRTFDVRVDLAPMAGLHPGMFGRLRVPVGERQAISLPAAAVERIGQLETVRVEHDGRWSRRLVTTGAALGAGRVEILSGLAGGETIGLPAE